MIAGICTLQGATAQTAPASTAAGQSAYVNTVQELTLTAAQKLVAAGVEYAAGHDMRLSVSVVDRAGNLLAFARMDGASIVTVDVAMGKARTAAFLKAPSKVFEDMINAGKPSMATTPGLLPLQGGMPVMYNGTVLGAVGVSGSSGENDQAVAALIADAFAKF
ncbi:MAG TPA: heme-binding protein [Paenirhodobacter sp.]